MTELNLVMLEVFSELAYQWGIYQVYDSAKMNNADA